MKRILFSFLIVYCLLSTVDCFSQGAWTQKADFGNGNTAYATGFSIGSKGYIGTGMDTTGVDTKSFWEWDQAANTWTQMADFGGPARGGAIGFSINGKGYIGTGRDQAMVFYNDLWEYDPNLNTWTQKTNFPGTARMYATAFAVGGFGSVGTGLITSSGSGAQNDFYKYDPGNDTWTQITFPGVARGPGVGFSIGTKGYIGTGNDITDQPTNDLWEYDPSNNSWAQKTNLPVAKCGASGFAIVSKGYIGTGQLISNTRDFYCYNPLSNTWSQKADFGGTARRHAVGFAIGLKGYMGTGSGTKDFWEYDPTAVGVQEIENKISCSIFPNPMNEKATIEIKNETGNTRLEMTFELHDLQGKKVMTSTLIHQTSTISRGDLPSGIYIYTISDKTKNLASGKLIIE